MQLLRLLQDRAWAVQLSSYDLLRRVVTQHVSDLVVETELDSAEELEIKLPGALVRLVEMPLVDELDDERTTAYLLAWLTAFSFFESAVRSSDPVRRSTFAHPRLSHAVPAPAHGLH